MKKILATALLSALPFTAAYAQAPEKNSPPEKAMDSATPEMKNPGGTDQLHPPQKAMDEATPGNSGASGASDGTGSATAPGAGGTTYNAQDANKAADDAGNKQKIPADNKIPHQGDQQKQQQ